MVCLNGKQSVKFDSIVSYVRKRIDSGAWQPGNRVPSENQLCEQFGISRMTAKRALDELAQDGLIVRRRGAGSFMAGNSVRSSFLAIRNIADEIAETGRVYSNRVLRQREVAASKEVASLLGLRPGDPVFHSLIVHVGDGEPVQLEYRYVRKDVVPGYLDVDLSLETPNHYLQRCCPLTDARECISAALPTRTQCAALSIEAMQPCLLITRVTKWRKGLVSYARILAPASRYQLAGQLQFSSNLQG